MRSSGTVYLNGETAFAFSVEKLYCEVAMKQSNPTKEQPTKEQVREYMQRRQAEHRPLPDLKEIRRQLGWDLAQLGSIGTCPK